MNATGRFSAQGDLFWAVTEAETAERLARLKPRQRLARIPGMAQLCQKRPFALLMRAAQERDPGAFRFWPRTWVFPEDDAPSSATFQREGPLIYKPSDGAQGDGIVLLNSHVEMKRKLAAAGSGPDCVLQSYLAEPLLLDGLKFDVRLYVLVTSLSPLRVLCCTEGLVRVCTKTYEAPSSRNSHLLNAHLTNYSVNKYEAGYQHDDDPFAGDRGTKRSLRAVWSHLETLGYDAAGMEREMHAVVAKTCAAMAGALRDEDEAMPASSLWPPQEQHGAAASLAGGRGGRAGSATPAGPAGGKKGLTQCFQLLGFDLMFSDNKAAEADAPRVHLLEVNCNPSLAIDSVFPLAGPHCCLPHPLPTDTPWYESCKAAMAQLPYKGARQCLCRDHHRPHLHAPSAVDLVAKRAAVGGAMTIVRRQMKAGSRRGGEGASEVTLAELARGTAYVPVMDDEELLC